MYSKINYTIVGLFVILFSAALFWFGFWLAKYSGNEKYNFYKIYFTESVSGLNKDSSVKYKGVEIGRVVKISLDPKDIGKVEVLVKIKANVPIKKDMYAHLELVGITGLETIVIEGGSNDSPLLKPKKKGEIPVIPSKPSWALETKQSVKSIAQEMRKTLQQLQKLLNDKNIQNFSAILENTKDATKRLTLLESNISANMATIKDAIKNFNTAAQTFKDKVALIGDDVHKISKELIPTIKTFKITTANFNKTINRVYKGLNRGDYNLRRIFEPLVVDGQIITEQLNILLRKLQNNPNSILFQSRKPIKGPGE